MRGEGAGVPKSQQTTQGDELSQWDDCNCVNLAASVDARDQGDALNRQISACVSARLSRWVPVVRKC